MDDRGQVIVAAEVSQNATDHAEFKPLVEQVERNLGGLPQEGSADARYSSYDNLEFAEGKGLDIPACGRQAWLGEGARGVFANVPGAQCEEDREESVPGHTHFA